MTSSSLFCLRLAPNEMLFVTSRFLSAAPDKKPKNTGFAVEIRTNHKQTLSSGMISLLYDTMVGWVGLSCCAPVIPVSKPGGPSDCLGRALDVNLRKNLDFFFINVQCNNLKHSHKSPICLFSNLIKRVLKVANVYAGNIKKGLNVYE